MSRTASKMVVTLSGNTQISTSQYKFGSSSIRLDGTGDYITVTDNGNFDFGTNDFTIEWWQRLDSLDRFAIDFRNGSSASNRILIYSYQYDGSADDLYLYTNANRITATSCLTANQWQHIAFVRSSGTTKLYIDGTQQGNSYSDSNSYSHAEMRIWHNSIGAENYTPAGYIDEYRVSNSARYTSNFTTPSARFEDDANTVFHLQGDGTNGSTDIQDTSPPYFVAGYFEQGYFEGSLPSGTTHEGAATLSAQATLSTTVLRIKQDTASLSSTATLSSTITRIRTGAGTLSATATLTSTVSRSRDGVGMSFSVTATLSGDVLAIREGQILITGAFTPTVTAVATKNSTAILDSTATLQFTISKFAGNEATLENIVNLSLQGTPIFAGNSQFNTSSVGGAQSSSSAQFTLTASTDKIKEANIQMDSPYLEGGYIDENYFVSQGFVLTATIDSFTLMAASLSAQATLSATTTRILSSSASASATASLSAQGNKITGFVVSANAAITLSATIKAIRGFGGTLSSAFALTANTSRIRDELGMSLESTASMTANILRFSGVNATLDAQAQLSATVGEVFDVSASLTDAFIPSMTVSALRNMTAVLDAVATLTTDVNVTTENTINLQTEFTKTTQGDRIRFINGSFTASFSVVQQQIETITPFEAQLSVEAQLQQQLIERIVPFGSILDTAFTKTVSADRIRDELGMSLSSQFTFVPVIGNLQQFSATLTDAFSPTMNVNAILAGLSTMTAQATASITAEKITDITSTPTATFTASIDGTRLRFGLDSGELVAVATINADVGIVFQSGFQSQSITFTQQTANVSLVSGSSGLDSVFTMAAVKVNAARPGIEFEAVGNAQLDNTYQQFGATALYLDGNGDLVRSTDSNNTAPYIDAPANWDSTTEYTIEFWFRPDWTYFNSVSTNLGQTYEIARVQDINFALIHRGGIGSSPTNNEMSLVLRDGTTSKFGSTTITASGGNIPPNSNGWYHVALTGHEATSNQFLHRLRLNGIKLGGSSYSDGAWFASSSQIAANASGVRIQLGSTSTGGYAGWIDEVRISHSARYPDEFPHPDIPLATSAFGNDEDTLALLHFDGTDGSTDMVDDGGFTTTFESSQSAQFNLTAQGDKFRLFSATFDVVATSLIAAVKTADFITVPDTQFVMTVDADFTTNVSAQLDSVASVSAEVTRIHPGEATLTSEATLTADADRNASGEAALTSTATVGSQINFTANGQAQLTDALAFGITVQLTRDTEQALTVTATMSASGDRIRFGVATLNSEATLSATANVLVEHEATLNSTATLSIDFTKIPEIQITASSVANITLTAGIERIRPFTATISDAMSFTTEATANLVGVTSIDIQATMSVSGTRLRFVSGALTSTAALSITAVKTVDINSTFNINASLSAIAFELQVFDLIYTVPNESRINTIESEQRLHTVRDENRLFTIEGD